MTADTTDDHLENFFSRPIKTQSYSWGTGTNLFETFNPWQDYFENPRVINRITNYNLLRCKLHVKFMLNGNGFHYGRAIASYIPLHNFDDFTKDRAFFQEDVVAASQRPHVYLDPTKSQGGELTLPFVWEANALSIPDQDWRDMGDIIIHGMQNLKHANGATDSVTVSVFVWASDVTLAVPTANEPGALTPQAGEYVAQAGYVPGDVVSRIPCPQLAMTSKCCNKTKVIQVKDDSETKYEAQAGDEYGQGMISKPASIVARAAGALADAPGIGVYAKATQLAANALSSIAKTFGFSRPAVINDIVPYRPTYMGNLANTNLPDSCTKLTLDAKQELTCDTRTFGLDGTDEMTIKSIAMRESYLTQFGWQVADSTETLLWNTEVSPVIWSELTPATVKEFHMPACCFAALPFKHWRGTMKFRFQVVASSFHKGRLKIVYDPSYPLSNEYNTNYTHIIDLAKERDFTVEIGWGQQWSFLQHRNMTANGGPIYNTTKLGSAPGKTANGILSVYVVNELTVPNSTANNDVSVNVFVSAGEDFEVANPFDLDIQSLSWYTPQSGEYIPQSGEMSQPDADLTPDESAPMKLEPTETMGPELTCTDHTLDVFFGDPVTSFRQCLKRYCYLHSLAPSGSSGFNRWVLSNFPMYRGYASGAKHQATTPVDPTPYNFAKMTMLNYVTPAFTCRRGGIRWKYLYTGSVVRGADTIGYMGVERDPSTVSVYSQSTIVPLGTGTTVSQRVAAELPTAGSGWPGAHVTPIQQNAALEVELPFYTEERFVPAKNGDVTGGDTRNFFHDLTCYVDANPTADVTSIRAYCSVGEDFTLGFFTGAPVAYLQSDPAASAL